MIEFSSRKQRTSPTCRGNDRILLLRKCLTFGHGAWNSPREQKLGKTLLRKGTFRGFCAHNTRVWTVTSGRLGSFDHEFEYVRENTFCRPKKRRISICHRRCAFMRSSQIIKKSRISILWQSVWIPRETTACYERGFGILKRRLWVHNLGQVCTLRVSTSLGKSEWAHAHFLRRLLQPEQKLLPFCVSRWTSRSHNAPRTLSQLPDPGTLHANRTAKMRLEVKEVSCP